MVWTVSQKTWTTSEVVTAAMLNQYLRDQLAEVAPAKVTAAGDTVYASGANALARLAVGSAGYMYRVVSGLPAWGRPGSTIDMEWSGDITPSQITSNQNDYNPTSLSTATVLRLSTDASRNLTSLAGGFDGRVLLLKNVGTNDLVLKNDDGATGTAANRFSLAADVTVTTKTSVLLWYDSTLSRWTLAGGSGAGGGGGGGTNYQTIENNGSAVTQRATLNIKGVGYTLTDDGETVLTLGQTPQGQTLGSGTVTLGSGNVTTTSTSFVDATGVTSTITTVGGAVRISLEAYTFQGDATKYNSYDLDRDGSSLSGAGLGIFAGYPTVNGIWVTLNHVDAAPSAGSHVYKLRWRVQGSTGTLVADGTNNKIFYSVKEEPVTTLVGTGGGTPLGSGSVTLTSGNITTTSTSMVDITGITSTITTSGGNIHASQSASISNSSTNSTGIDLVVDGASQSGGSYGFQATTSPGAGAWTNAAVSRTVTGLTASSHTVKPQWRVSGGTSTYYASNSVNQVVASFTVQELPATNTLVQAGAALGSGSVTLSSGNVTTTSTSLVDLTGATKTVILQGGDVRVSQVLMVSNSGVGNQTWTEFVRGSTALGGGSRGIISTYSFVAAYVINLSISHLDVAPAAGSTTYKIQWAVDAGTGTVYADGTFRKMTFSVREEPLTTLGGVVGTGAVLGSGSVTITSGNITTTSTSFVDLTGVSVSLTTVGGSVHAAFVAYHSNSSLTSNIFDLVRGSTSLGVGVNGILYRDSNPTGSIYPVNFTFIDVRPTAAAYTYKIQWKVGTGTGTIYADGSNRARLFLDELPTTTGGPRSPLHAHLAGDTIATGVTEYACPDIGTFDTTEANREGLVPFTGLLRNFRVRTSTAQSAGGTLVFTLRINGVDTALTFSIGAGAVAGTYGDTTNTVAVSGGDRISWKVVNNGSGTSAAVGPIVMELAG